MSENARRKSDGQMVKIGTCESMYYLRFSQRQEVHYPWPALTDSTENLDPFMYRFPNPTEDGTEPGDYSASWGRGIPLTIRGFWGSLQGVAHGAIQATGSNGYLFNLPCPEANPELYKGPYGEAPQMHRNGGTTTVTIVAQRWYAGHLALVVKCAACSCSIRLPELTDAAAILDALKARGDAERRQADCWFGGRDTTDEIREQVRENMRRDGAYWDEIAARVIAGYEDTGQEA